MHYAQEEMVKVLDRAADFATEFAPLMGALPALDALAEVRQALLSTASDQYGAGKASVAGTATKGELRERLRAHHLVPLSRFALTRREEIPVLKMEKFRVPPRGASDVSLLAAAGAMAKLAEEYYPLIRGDLGDDFPGCRPPRRPSTMRSSPVTTSVPSTDARRERSTSA